MVYLHICLSVSEDGLCDVIEAISRSVGEVGDGVDGGAYRKILLRICGCNICWWCNGLSLVVLYAAADVDGVIISTLVIFGKFVTVLKHFGITQSPICNSVFIFK